MSEEIDISKLHGKIKEYARMADRDENSSSEGYGKLNTKYELNIFKDMIARDGLQEELKRQLPYMKGVSVPISSNADNEDTDVNTKDSASDEKTIYNINDLRNINRTIIDYIKDNKTITDSKSINDLIAQKSNIIRNYEISKECDQILKPENLN